MTWQEELRKLDESLASGNLSADEYRTRRDQILSSAVSSPEQAAETSEPSKADATQVIAPLSGSPQPQTGQQPAQTPQQPSPEATQVVPQNDPGAERTQAVSPWQMQQMQQQQQGGQAYPASPAGGFQQPASPAGGFQQPAASPPGGFAAQPQNQPWNAAQEDSSPPWGGGDFPPLSPQGSQEWGVSQGPESFDDTESSGKSRKVLLSVIAVLLVAGIGVAVYFLFIAGGDDDPGPAAPSQSQNQPPPPPTESSTPLPKPPPPKEEPADNDAALIDPPGKERPGGGPFDYEFLEKNSDMLPQTVVDALGDADMDDGLLKTTITDDKMTIGMYSIEVGTEDDAVAIANEYGVAQQEGGIPAERELAMQGVQVYAAGAQGDSVVRGVYVLYDRVIIIDVFGEGRKNVEPLFNELLEEQVNHAPPTYTGP